MGKILKLAFWVALVYVAVVYGWPWLQERIESVGETTASSAKSLSVGEGGRCVDLASRAADDFGAGMRNFSSPPYDQDAWGEFVAETRDQVSYAQGECSCSESPCTISREALYELDTLVGDFDQMVRRQTTSFLDPARDMERIYDLLGQARSEIP